jgi:hypothetical protein
MQHNEEEGQRHPKNDWIQPNVVLQKTGEIVIMTEP